MTGVLARLLRRAADLLDPGETVRVVNHPPGLRPEGLANLSTRGPGTSPGPVEKAPLEGSLAARVAAARSR